MASAPATAAGWTLLQSYNRAEWDLMVVVARAPVRQGPRTCRPALGRGGAAPVRSHRVLAMRRPATISGQELVPLIGNIRERAGKPRFDDVYADSIFEIEAEARKQEHDRIVKIIKERLYELADCRDDDTCIVYAKGLRFILDEIEILST